MKESSLDILTDGSISTPLVLFSFLQGLCRVLLNGTKGEAGEAGSEGGRGRGTTESVEVSGGR